MVDFKVHTLNTGFMEYDGKMGADPPVRHAGRRVY